MSGRTNCTNWKVIGCIAAALSSASAHAATPGVPDPPRPGPPPQAWVSWIDDALNAEVGDNRDDWRSNAFAGGARIGGAIVAVDYSNLTDKRGLGGRPARVDEATATLGTDWQLRADGRFASLGAGAGARAGGDLGGAAVQGVWHRALGLAEVDLPYERRSLTGVAYLRGEWLESVRTSGGRLGAQLGGEFLVTSDAETQGACDLRVLYLGREAELWVGISRRMGNGLAPSPTARLVAAHERGWWIEAGYGVGPYAVSASVDPWTRAATGQVSLLIDAPPLNRDPAVTDVVGSIGATATAAGLVNAVSWRPRWLSSIAWLGPRARLVGDHRFGRVPGWHAQDTSLRYRQTAAGIEVTPWLAHPSALPQPFATLLMGWRMERIQHEGPMPAYSEQRAGSPVAQLSIGARIAITGGCGLDAAIDSWCPWRSTRTSDGAGLLAPGIGGRVLVSCRVPW